MADGTCSSEALISFLLEISRDEEAQKSTSTKKQCCQRFLSLFENFDLGEFLLGLEELVEKHWRVAADSSKSYSERSQELVFVTRIKVGSLRILDWLFTAEYAKCRKFIAESVKLIDEAFKSGRRQNTDESSSLGSEPGPRRPAPKRTRKPRNRPGNLDDCIVEEAMHDMPDQCLEEPEIEECSFDEPTTVGIADVADDDVHPTMPLESSVMEFEEEAPPEEIVDVCPSFQLQPLSGTESAVVSREPRRRRTIDRNVQLSVKAMRKHLLESSKLSRTVEENRVEIPCLCSKLPSALDLLQPGPCVARGQEMTKIFTEWYKRPRLERNGGLDQIEEEHGAPLADYSDEILHDLMQTTDDPSGISEPISMRNGGRVTPPAPEVSDLQDSAYFLPGADSTRLSPEIEQVVAAKGTPDDTYASRSSPDSRFDDDMAEVYALILRNASRFHQEGDNRLRYACLSEISSSVPREHIATLFKYMLLLCESEQLYVTQLSETSNEVFIFPRGQASVGNV